MRIPESFKAIQRQTFQDKQLDILAVEEVKGELGGIVGKQITIAGSTMVNLQVISDVVFAQQWSLVAGQDAVATCSDPVPVERNGLVQCRGTVYQVMGILQHDSHVKLVLKRTNEKAVV